jgi:hypothetical protein
MPQFQSRGALQFGQNLLRQYLAEFHTPLVERVDVPDRALREDAVLIQGDERAQDVWRQPVGQNDSAGPIAGEGAVRILDIRIS